MITILAQIAPQRSTQYAALAAELAPHELQLSSLGSKMTSIEPVELGGQAYLRFELQSEPGAVEAEELAMLAMTSGYFVYFEKLGRTKGPLLRPIESSFKPALPPSLMMARRYRGKTNEMFTHFMCNVARFSSDFAARPWSELRLFDPLMGGGTTLFAALMLGADVAGVDTRTKDVESTAAFLKQFMREQRIGCQEKQERLKQLGRRWRFTLGRRKMQQHCLLAAGDTLDSKQLLGGFQPHLIVADLPYGIQHRGALEALVRKAVPVWAGLLPKGGTLIFAWESKRFSRAHLIDLVQTVTPLQVYDQPPYNQLAHRVDRVIKERDLLVARK